MSNRKYLPLIKDREAFLEAMNGDHKSLAHAFYFARTPQGAKFWNAVYRGKKEIDRDFLIEVLKDDLRGNKIPFRLLSEEEQKILKDALYTEGVVSWDPIFNKWAEDGEFLYPDGVYRIKPPFDVSGL